MLDSADLKKLEIQNDDFNIMPYEEYCLKYTREERSILNALIKIFGQE